MPETEGGGPRTGPTSKHDAISSFREVAHGKEAPFPWHPFEGPGTTVSEVDPRAHDQVLDRARNEYLVRSGEPRDAGRDVHSDPGKFSVTELTLARVNAGSDR